MKLQHLTFVALMALSAPAMAATQYDVTPAGASSQGKLSLVSAVIGASYDSWLDNWTSLFSSYTLTGPVSATVANFGTSFTATITENGFSQDFIYSVSKSGTGAATRYVATAAFNEGAVTAVPGPEAGAGIGALALGGMALYMKRRRKEDEALAA